MISAEALIESVRIDAAHSRSQLAVAIKQIQHDAMMEAARIIKTRAQKEIPPDCQTCLCSVMEEITTAANKLKGTM